MSAVSVRSATKRYGAVLAVDDVSLEVQQGEVYALLGLNGAGKTTLIRMLLGMVRPTSGDVRLLDRPVAAGAGSTWGQVGYLVETAAAYPELTVRENLEVVRRLRHGTGRHAVSDVIERLGLSAYADRRAGTLSLGNAQRLGLAKALLHRPSLLVLDEPVNGLDPAGVVEVRTMLVDLARTHGVTVVLSSHLLGEVARTASRIGVLHQGRLVEELRTDELAGRVRTHLEVGARDLDAARTALRFGGMDPRPVGSVLRLAESRAVADPGRVASLLVQAGVPPTRLAVVEEDLETYFLRLVGTTDAELPEVSRVG